jgi:hypothetical protein
MDTILSSFVHAAVDLDDKSLDNLELLIREKRRTQEEERGD